MSVHVPRATLLKITKDGSPVSYIKGVSHNHNNVCSKTIKALKKCSVYLYETKKDYFKGRKNSEDILYKYALRKRLDKKWIDKNTLHLRKDIKRAYNKMGWTQNKSPYKGQLNEWLSDQDNFIQYKSHLKIMKTKSHYKKFKNVVVKARNSIWYDLMKTYMYDQSVFLCCGDNHLSDFIRRLEDDGFKVYNVKQSKQIKN